MVMNDIYNLPYYLKTILKLKRRSRIGKRKLTLGFWMLKQVFVNFFLASHIIAMPE